MVSVKWKQHTPGLNGSFGSSGGGGGGGGGGGLGAELGAEGPSTMSRSKASSSATVPRGGSWSGQFFFVNEASYQQYQMKHDVKGSRNEGLLRRGRHNSAHL